MVSKETRKREEERKRWREYRSRNCEGACLEGGKREKREREKMKEKDERNTKTVIARAPLLRGRARRGRERWR